MVTNQPTRRKPLPAIVGVAAATVLVAFTPKWEGTVYGTYRDLGGVLTYCTGATEDAQWGKTYTPEECKAQLDRDLSRHAEGISRCVDFGKLHDGAKVAFVDAAYNIGVNNFCDSSMAKKARAGDIRGACDSLLLWNKVKGREVAGLTRRRQAGREICLKGLP